MFCIRVLLVSIFDFNTSSPSSRYSQARMKDTPRAVRKVSSIICPIEMESVSCIKAEE